MADNLRLLLPMTLYDVLRLQLDGGVLEKRKEKEECRVCLGKGVHPGAEWRRQATEGVFHCTPR